MKELSIKEKARRYDEAIEKAKAWCDCEYATTDDKILLKRIFPELKESEDESIRKALIYHYQCDGFLCTNGYRIDYKDIRAWLEKQGKQDLADKAEPKFDDVEEVNFFDDFRKTDSEVEPKFKERDWVIIDGETLHITNVTEDGYSTEEGGYIPFRCEKDVRLWTIRDAKDGDVLACPNDAGDRDVVFIFKSINSDEGWVFCFCASDANGCFCTNNDYVGNSNSTNISPATKEQREQLEKVMADAGYTFDFEKKELKKIEQKKNMHNKLTDFESSLKHIMEEAIECGDTHNLKADADMLLSLVQKPTAWSEEDTVMLNKLLAVVELYYKRSGNDLDKQSCITWLKSLKERVQPKQKWSEEDEDAIAEAIIALEDMYDPDEPERCYAGYTLTFDKAAERLKSLRPQPQWKPSDEQITWLY